MHARLITTYWRPGKRQEGEKLAWDTIVPAFRQQSGFRGYWLFTDAGDKAVCLTLWDSEADLNASAPVADSLRELLKDFVLEPPVAQDFKVSINAELPPLLADTEPGALLDINSSEPGVIVAFGGLKGRLGTLPTFEFRRTLESIGTNSVYLRDHHRAWYHRGIVGVGPDIDSVAAWLEELADEHGPLIMIGNSGGGYAALMFGGILGCEAHAFSPQVFIDPELREQYGDRRWEQELSALQRTNRLDQRYTDLLPLLAESSGTFHVHHGGDDLDRLHAERLGSLPQVTLHHHDISRHDMVRELRDSGWLRDLARQLAP